MGEGKRGSCAVPRASEEELEGNTPNYTLTPLKTISCSGQIDSGNFSSTFMDFSTGIYWFYNVHFFKNATIQEH